MKDQSAAPVFLKLPNGTTMQFKDEAEARHYEACAELNPGSLPRVPAPAGAGDRLRLEALALRRVFALPPDERAEAAAKLNAAALVLDRVTDACARAMRDGVRLELVDLDAMRTGRPELRLEDEALRASPDAEAALDPGKGYDPDTLAEAYARALEDTACAGELRRVDDAERLLARCRAAKNAGERRALMDDAAWQLHRAERATEGTLAEAWDAHLDRWAADLAAPDEVLRLDARKRGPWAAWVNDCLGTRAGLEPGQTFFLGGAPEAGKTSWAALLAVDALAVGCPVLFWQLELSREETLEHLQAQRPDLAGWPGLRFWPRARQPLPEAWAELLTVPRWPDPEAETLERALLEHARKAERARRSGKVRHAVNGLVVVDYVQLLTMAARGPKDAGHEVLCTAASRLAKAAAESGACLLVLSQLNKQDQRDAATDGTALAGADLARMAHRVALLQKADAEGKPCKAGVEVALSDHGEARLLTWTKRRGMRYAEDRRPDRARVLWYNVKARALHGGDMSDERGCRLEY